MPRSGLRLGDQSAVYRARPSGCGPTGPPARVVWASRSRDDGCWSEQRPNGEYGGASPATFYDHTPRALSFIGPKRRIVHGGFAIEENAFQRGWPPERRFAATSCGPAPETVPEPLPSGLRGLKQDCVFGAAAASIAGLAVWVFILGQKTRLGVGWAPLQVAIAGLAVAEWLKFGLTGKHLSLGEALQDLLVSGGLAATVTRCRSCKPRLAGRIFFSSSWRNRGSQHRGLPRRQRLSSGIVRPALESCSGGFLILGMVYAVGSLLLLESTNLLGSRRSQGPLARGLGELFVLGFLARVAVVFGFNLAAANRITGHQTLPWLRSFKGTLSLLTVAVAAVAAPGPSPIAGPAGWLRHGPRHYGFVPPC